MEKRGRKVKTARRDFGNKVLLLLVCFRRYSRALSQSFLSCSRDLPVAVNHLNQEPELQPDDGDVHHHLRQDGRHSPGN